MSTLRVNTITDAAGTGNASAAQLGVGQTWQNVTGSRALGTTYTNTTGRPIAVAVQSVLTTGQALQITVSGVVAAYMSNAQAANNASGVFTVIPTGATYAATGGTLQAWSELR